MNNFNDYIPDLAKGNVIPQSVIERQLEEEKQKELRKQQQRHNWKITLFGTIGGAMAGFITSLTFWIITNLLF